MDQIQSEIDGTAGGGTEAGAGNHPHSGPDRAATLSRSAVKAFGGHHQRADISGSIFAGTPMAVKPAGTLLITREFAAIIAPSPIFTAPMILE
jgi:hypothetical protein